ncbi:phage tail terminator family protein [Geosporobacter ferrireducens]|uniref:phage tail terminator family protein n=1 Tax=Geosporobacter ferrireducens TaxID=1424294 RepID=UPI00139BA5D4|nr:hypothetical protein [Geosporobacter ferrireducens]MTI57484.1 hypothetical protein [Geosporobacter ferrireducens]
MIKLVEIQNAVDDKLNTNFPAYPIYVGEIPQEITRPAFFMHILPVSTRVENKYYRNRKINVEIRYFSRNETHLENLNMADLLNELFDSFLMAGNRKLMVEETRTIIEENVLCFTFDIEFSDSIDEEKAYDYQDYEYMEELLIKED